jgi:excisionase family DNA binding protein
MRVRRTTGGATSIPQLEVDEQCLLVHIEEAAQQLAVSQRTVERLVDEGSLRSVKVLHSRRIARSDLEAFVQRLRDTERPHATFTVDGREAKVAARIHSVGSRMTRVALNVLGDLSTTFASKFAAELFRILIGSP